MRKPNSECTFDGCFEEVHAKGLCPGHHAQMYRVGVLSPLKPSQTDEERFWTNVTKTDSCWIWTGRTENGRGRMWVGERNKLTLAHVYSFEIHGGVVPEGMEIDHRCQNPICVNPSHLRAVTRTVNARNKGLNRRNSSGYKGVHYTVKTGKWTARVRVGGRSIYVGHFDDVHEAGKAALLGRMERYGEWNLYDESLAKKFGIPYPSFEEWV